LYCYGSVISFRTETTKEFKSALCKTSASFSIRLAVMGNQIPSVDLVTKLPYEVLGVVLTFLTLNDVLRCLQVCKTWKENILNNNQYWIGMLRTHLNISQSCQNKYSSLFFRRSDTFFEIKSLLVELEPARFSYQPPACYPVYPTASCFVMCQQGVIVRRGESRVFVERLLTRGSVLYVQTLGSVDMDSSCNVKWAHLSRNRLLYWLDGSTKLGTCYDISSNRVLHSFDFLSDIPSEGRSLASGSKGDNCRASVACCEECSLGIVCYSSMQSSWRNEVNKRSWKKPNVCIKVFSLGDANRKPELLYFGEPTFYDGDCHKKHNQFIAIAYDASLQIVSTSKHRGNFDCSVCSEHSLLLSTKGQNILLSINVPSNNREGIPTHHHLPSNVFITAAVLSCKEQPLSGGAKVSASVQKLKNFFHTWIVNENGTKLGDCSNKIQVSKMENIQQTSWSIVCVGQQLSIVRFGTELSSISEDKYLVICTENGKLYKEIQNLPSKLTSTYDGSKVLGHFISQEALLWLDDLRNACPTVLMTVVMGDTMGKLQFLLVQRNSDPLGGGCSEYAINMCFIK